MRRIISWCQSTSKCLYILRSTVRVLSRFDLRLCLVVYFLHELHFFTITSRSEILNAQQFLINFLTDLYFFVLFPCTCLSNSFFNQFIYLNSVIMFALFVKRFKHFAGSVQWQNRINAFLKKRCLIGVELRQPSFCLQQS